MGACRVILLTDADVFAGTERHILELARALPAEGVAARVACPVPSPLAARAAAAGVGVVPVAKRGLLDWRAVRTLRGLLRRGEADLLHAHNGRTALLAAAAVAAAGRGRCVATQHFLRPTRVGRRGAKAWLSAALHGWAGRRTAHLIAISEAVRAAAVARGDAGERRITVVPNGIDPPDEARLAAADRVRDELGAGAGATLVVCAARLEREKDVPSLVEAVRLAAPAVPGLVCAVAGGGAERPALERQVAAAGLTGRVRLLGFREDVLSLIRAADVFVLPSLAEPFGLALLEAMALARPVVATRAGGPLEIVEDGATGLLVPPADPPALADALVRLAADAGLCRRMGRAGRERFDRLFTARRMAAATTEVYRQAVGLEAAAIAGRGGASAGAVTAATDAG